MRLEEWNDLTLSERDAIRFGHLMPHMVWFGVRSDPTKGFACGAQLLPLQLPRPEPVGPAANADDVLIATQCCQQSFGRILPAEGSTGGRQHFSDFTVMQWRFCRIEYLHHTLFPRWDSVRGRIGGKHFERITAPFRCVQVEERPYLAHLEADPTKSFLALSNLFPNPAALTLEVLQPVQEHLAEPWVGRFDWRPLGLQPADLYRELGDLLLHTR